MTLTSMAEELDSYWDEDAAVWEESSLKVFSYDGNGNEKGYLKYDWKRDPGACDRKDSTFNSYDEQGQHTEYEGYQWDGSRWVIRYYNEYSYASDGLMSEKISRMWYENDQDVYEGPWVEESKMEYEYNEAGQLIVRNSVIWETDDWQIYWTDTLSLSTLPEGVYLSTHRGR